MTMYLSKRLGKITGIMMIVAVTKVAIKIPPEVILCFELDCVLLARFEKIKPAHIAKNTMVGTCLYA